MSYWGHRASWAGWFRPIHLGQSARGFVLATLLILLWQCGRTAFAQTGYAENDYFRVEWEYKLDEGEGVLKFYPTDPWTSLALYGFGFNTIGIELENINYWGQNPFYDPYQVGEKNGYPIYRYQLLSTTTLFGWLGQPGQISFNFPVGNVRPYCDTTLIYSWGSVSAAGGMVSAMNFWGVNAEFVSVQALTENTRGDCVCPNGVEQNDLRYMVERWLQTGPTCADIAPPGGDGKVDLNDFSVLAKNWLAGPD